MAAEEMFRANPIDGPRSLEARLHGDGDAGREHRIEERPRVADDDPTVAGIGARAI